MPEPLSRLSCGVIYTNAFRDWLEELYRQESPAHSHRVPSLDYVRCASGPEKGRAWWQVLWLPEDMAPAHQLFQMGSVRVHIPKSAQLGLRDRCLDCKDGEVVVNP